jgi:hypothetical protein
MIPKNWANNGFPPNVWAMASTENQQRFDERVVHLRKVPATVLGFSCEPLLSAIEFKGALDGLDPSGLWVIAGGESGRRSECRPSQYQWFSGMRDQCVGRGVPFFFKQWAISVATAFITAINRTESWTAASGISSLASKASVARSTTFTYLGIRKWHAYRSSTGAKMATTRGDTVPRGLLRWLRGASASRQLVFRCRMQRMVKWALARKRTLASFPSGTRADGNEYYADASGYDFDELSATDRAFIEGHKNLQRSFDRAVLLVDRYWMEIESEAARIIASVQNKHP